MTVCRRGVGWARRVNGAGYGVADRIESDVDRSRRKQHQAEQRREGAVASSIFVDIAVLQLQREIGRAVRHDHGDGQHAAEQGERREQPQEAAVETGAQVVVEVERDALQHVADSYAKHQRGGRSRRRTAPNPSRRAQAAPGRFERYLKPTGRMINAASTRNIAR